MQLIYRRKSKTDKSDALLLARLGRFDPTLLAPVRHRGRSAQLDLACLRSRDMLVSARTDPINHVRGLLKPFGLRVPDCGSGAFVRQAQEVVPPELTPALAPDLQCLRVLDAELARYEKQVEHLAAVSYPETARLSQVSGVGPITAPAYVLTIEEPSRFSASRTMNSFVGLTPAKDQSGESDPQKHISKAGDPFLRRLLVQFAHYSLRPSAKIATSGAGNCGSPSAAGKHRKRRRSLPSSGSSPYSCTASGSLTRTTKPSATPRKSLPDVPIRLPISRGG